MLILQEPWQAKTDDPAPETIRAIIAFSGQEMPLVLLPLSLSEHETQTDPFHELLASWAAECKAYLAAAVRDSQQTLAGLADPTGKLLIKTTGGQPPDPQTGRMPTAMTPEGQVGLLCDTEILSPYRVRSQVFSGAEILLNPSCERSDGQLPQRLAARQARAYENLAWVACASPKSVKQNGVSIELPAATLACDPSGHRVDASGETSYVQVDIDIDTLRSRRQEPMRNFPAIVRSAVYVDDLETIPRPETPAPDTDLRYDAVLCQHIVHQSKAPSELLPNRERNLEDALNLVSPIARQGNVRLAVLPEFFITGPVSPLGDESGHLAKDIGIEIPGPEVGQLGDFAKAHGVFLCAGAFEFDPEWPNRFFNTAFILDDAGELILKYRKIHCGDVMGFLPDTTPGSVFSAYVERYGYESLFPVVDTAIGRLAATICFDMNFPETYSALARRGAEVILHPTSEPHNSGRSGWDVARHTRAFENQAYVLSCGHGGEHLGGAPLPTSRARGYSKIVNFDGQLQVVADGPGRLALPGTIDIGALRRYRKRHPLVSREPNPRDFAPAYRQPRGIPNDLWIENPMRNPYRQCRQIRAVIDRYRDEGIFPAPG